MNFYEHLEKYKVISIIGLAKNVSKTTTLNHILKNLKSKYILGLTSIGRDGEKYDVITDLPKPRIHIEKGTYVATAKQSLENSDISVELIKKTGIDTPMGEVLILRATSSGDIELAGPSINQYLLKVCTDLKNIGCDLILIDGAFDRKAYATPLISEATILSTGASVSNNIQKVIDITIHTVELLTLEAEKDEEILKLATDILKISKIGIIDKNNATHTIDVLTALDAAKDIAENINENSKYVVINGALTDKLIEDLMKITNLYKGITFLVEDGTKLFLSKKVFRKFIKKGALLKVIKPIKIIAITINPTSPSGYNFDKKKLLNLLKEELEIPVFDLGP